MVSYSLACSQSALGLLQAISKHKCLNSVESLGMVMLQRKSICASLEDAKKETSALDGGCLPWSLSPHSNVNCFCFFFFPQEYLIYPLTISYMSIMHLALGGGGAPL